MQPEAKEQRGDRGEAHRSKGIKRVGDGKGVIVYPKEGPGQVIVALPMIPLIPHPAASI